MMDDFRQAFRALRTQWTFAAVAVATLIAGISVNVTLFSMFSAFFLQPLAVSNAHELVLVMQRSDAMNLLAGHSYPDYRDYRTSTTVFSDLVAYMPTPAHVSAVGQAPERTWIEVVSPNYFALADVTPAIGAFPSLPHGESPGDSPSVVLSHRYWQRRFGGDRSIVGRPVTINGRSFTVVAVAPASFTGLSWAMAVSAFVPAGSVDALLENGSRLRESRGSNAWRLIGRLAPGKSLVDARAEMQVAAKQLADQYPEEHRGSRVVVMPENQARPDPSFAGFLPVFAVVFGAMVALVLLIACANVANLMLSRAVARQRDLVVRSALGASRFRLIRLQVIESLIVAAIAGALGLLVAEWSGQLLTSVVPTGDIPVVEERATDWRIYAFTVLVSIAAGVMAGFWPARTATRFDLIASLRDAGAGAVRSRHALRNLLVVGQVTMSLVVLTSAGLFMQSLRQTQSQPLGFTSAGVLMMSVDLGLQQYSDERGRRFLEELLTRADALPGVVRATTSSHVPFDYAFHLRDITTADGQIAGTKDGYLSSAYTVAGPNYFSAMGATLLRGRVFDGGDHERASRVAVVNETMAARLWPGREAVGERFRFGRSGPWIEVVGVVANGKYVMLAEEPRTYFYLPLAQEYRSPMTLMLRAGSDPASLVTPVRQLLGELDPNLPLFNVKTLETHVRESVLGLMPLRVAAGVAAVQGVIALLLAVMGLYAVVSYGVTRRVREIGVRMALGAERPDVLRLVLGEGMKLTVVGATLGLLIAAGLGVVLSKLLYGLAAIDAGVLVAATVIVVGVSALACLLPARRATRADPLVALRYE